MELVAQVARASPPDPFQAERPELEPPSDHSFLLVILPRNVSIR